jgi:undecaprenyl diphosphate synthase
MRRIGEGPVNEASVAASLYEPADCEPDLVLILGSDDRLPPSLVWELAYSELIFRSTGWQELAADDIEVALAEFAGRRRRFGGLDA